MAGLRQRQALEGIRVIEMTGGIAGAYCGRLLADCGAQVLKIEPDAGGRLRLRREMAAESATEGLLHGWLNAGKIATGPAEAHALCGTADIVIVDEEAGVDASSLHPRACLVDIDWFRRGGPYEDWAGSDIVVQALTGMMHLSGPQEGPPMFMGDCQASFIGGLTAFVAAMAGLLAPDGTTHRFEVSIHEANMILSELQLAYAQASGEPASRSGINRFKPNCPVGIYPCKEGWLGLTALTPAQWEGLCDMLGLIELKNDPDFATSAGRHERVERLEEALIRGLSARSAREWAEEGRRRRVPMAPVPDAQGILAHPVFAERNSLAHFTHAGRSYRVPRTPFALTATPVRTVLDEQPADAASLPPDRQARSGATAKPLTGLRVADFSMGWAGPLVTRIMADLGAEILKIEAGRYPDWWRAVDWSPEAIAQRQHEQALHFSALNRGKLGVSLDLTTEAGRDLALELIAASDAVVENQAAGVVEKLGLGREAAQRARPDLVMMSMSAFGSGNSWSDTRAYGSTLEHGCGLPSFAGWPGTPPSMAHLAYGDAVGGLYGCGALLTALVHRRRTGEGQFVNLSMVECMLQFTTPPLLAAQAAGREPERPANRHPTLSPHGCFPAAGEDQWIALAVDGEDAFAALAKLIGRQDWLEPGFAPAARLAEIETAIAQWTQQREPADAADVLQKAGIAAAPVLHAQTLAADEHLSQTGFLIDIDRPVSGMQRQMGLAITEAERRLYTARPAPSLGGSTREILESLTGVSASRFETLVQTGIVSTSPTQLRAPAAPAREMIRGAG